MKNIVDVVSRLHNILVHRSKVGMVEVLFMFWSGDLREIVSESWEEEEEEYELSEERGEGV